MAKIFFLSIAALTLVALSAEMVNALENIRIGRELLAMDFPTHSSCNREPSESPYRLSDPFFPGPGEYKPGRNDPKANGLMPSCWTIEKVSGCNPKSTCCNKQDVYRVEIAVPPGRASFCKSYQKMVTINGKFKTFYFDLKDSLIRITGLNLNYKTAPGTRICLWATDWADCNSPYWMCLPTEGSCKIAIYNKKVTCCPVSWTGDRNITDDYDING